MIFSFFSGPIFVYLVVSFPLSVSSFYSSWLLPPALSLLFLCFSCSLSHRLCISYLIYCCRCRSRHRCRRLCGLIVVCSSSYVSSNSSHFLLCFTVVVVLSVLSGFLYFSLFFSFVALLPGALYACHAILYEDLSRLWSRVGGSPADHIYTIGSLSS